MENEIKTLKQQQTLPSEKKSSNKRLLGDIYTQAYVSFGQPQKHSRLNDTQSIKLFGL